MGVVNIVVAVLLLTVSLQAGGQVTSSQDADALSQSVTSYGVSLYNQLTSGNSDNLVFSPFSVFVSLAMTLLVSDDATKEELMNVITSLPSACYQRRKLRPVQDYGVCWRAYGGELKPFDERDPEAAINSRVAEATGGMIPDLVPRGHIADTFIMPLNTVFFKGRWESPFHPSLTRKSDFTTETGSVVKVPMMHQMAAPIRSKNIEDLNAQVMELSYKGNRVSLFLVMPDTWNGLANLESRLDNQTINNIVNDMPPPTEAELFLPKFRLMTHQTLNEPLKAMGLRSESSTRANFRRRSTNSFFLTMIIHEVFKEVDETGTKVAGATAVLGGPTSASSDIVLSDQISELNIFTNVTETGSGAATVRKVHAVPASASLNSITVNKPFMFILRDKISGINLFIGRFADPSQKRP